MSNEANSRKHPRIGPILIRADFWFGQRACRGYVTNLSMGGAFVAARELVPVGTAIRLVMSLPWQLGRLEVDAAVVWRRAETAGSPEAGSMGFGVQFQEPAGPARETLQAYVEQFHQLAARLPSGVA